MGEDLLTRLQASVPGFKGYRQKPMRHGDDMLLRERLCNLLGDARTLAMRAQQRATASGKQPETRVLISKLIAALNEAEDQTHREPYGGTGGWYDRVKISEAELNRLYGRDVALLDKATGLREMLEEILDLSGGSEQALKKMCLECISSAETYTHNLADRAMALRG